MFKLIIIWPLILMQVLIFGQTNRQGETPDEIYQKGLKEFSYGDIDSAVQQLEKLLTFHPQNQDYYEYLGYLYFVQGKYEKSVKVMSKILQMNSSSIIGLLVMGEIYYQQNDIVRAREVYERLDQTDSGIKLVHIRLYELLKNNNPKKANEHYLKVFQLPSTKMEKYLPNIENINRINISKKSLLIKDPGFEKKINITDDFLDKIFVTREQSTNLPDKAVIMTVKKKEGLKIDLSIFSSPFKGIDWETFYTKLVEVFVVSIFLVIYSTATRRKKERLKRIVVSNYRTARANKAKKE